MVNLSGATKHQQYLSREEVPAADAVVNSDRYGLMSAELNGFSDGLVFQCAT